MVDAPLERLISSIYDSAIDNHSLTAALTALAEVTHCQAASLEVFSSEAKSFIAGHNPLIAPEYAQSFLNNWRRLTPRRKGSGLPSRGMIACSADLYDRETVTSSAFFHEWLRPQGLGGDGRYATIASNGSETAVLGAFKAFKAPDFSRKDQKLFGFASRHFQRSFEIHDRLQLAEMQLAAADRDEALPGFIIIDKQSRILKAAEKTHRQLYSAGLIHPRGELRIFSPFVAARNLTQSDGSEIHLRNKLEVPGKNGERLQLTIIPMREAATPNNPWMAVGQRATIVWVRAPERLARQRVERLASDYHLTSAEKGIVIEIAKGRGRAAVARELGISVATVRSHLSSIFEKLQIHRQAELIRLVMSEVSHKS